MKIDMVSRLMLVLTIFGGLQWTAEAKLRKLGKKSGTAKKGNGKKKGGDTSFTLAMETGAIVPLFSFGPFDVEARCTEDDTVLIVAIASNDLGNTEDILVFGQADDPGDPFITLSPGDSTPISLFDRDQGSDTDVILSTNTGYTIRQPEEDAFALVRENSTDLALFGDGINCIYQGDFETFRSDAFIFDADDVNLVQDNPVIPPVPNGCDQSCNCVFTSETESLNTTLAPDGRIPFVFTVPQANDDVLISISGTGDIDSESEFYDVLGGVGFTMIGRAFDTEGLCNNNLFATKVFSVDKDTFNSWFVGDDLTITADASNAVDDDVCEPNQVSVQLIYEAVTC